jgi:hypothetical protein
LSNEPCFGQKLIRGEEREEDREEEGEGMSEKERGKKRREFTLQPSWNWPLRIFCNIN